MSDSPPSMGSWKSLLEIFAFVAAALFLTARLAPRLWRIISLSVRIAIVAGAVFVSLAASALVMNNETIFAPPGVGARIRRFLTVDRAATSKKGIGSAPCGIDEAASATTGAAAKSGAASSGVRTAGSRLKNGYYPELITRGYPGIPRSKLFAMAQATVRRLGGWRIVKSEPHSGSLGCVYTTRLLGFRDDVQIKVTRRNEVELCSRSRIGEAGSRSLLRFFHGDFGANIAHIKQFYSALNLRTNAFYAELQVRQMGGD